jgi:2-oxoglutarate dehydrogenase E2 component (dihydrolipoamide succinyltransferase)
MNIAQNEGVSMQELQLIKGTGSQGRVTKKDIVAFIANKKILGSINQPAENQINNNFNSANDTKGILVKPTSIYDTNEGLLSASTNSKLANPSEVVVQGHTEILEMDRMRKLIAKHMVDSVQTSPHVTSFVEADVTNMVVWRDKVKQLFEKREGIKITFTPMFLECIASVLEKYPMVNSSLQGDQIILRKDINIGMATALPTGNLIVPVIKGANQLSIVGLSKAVNNLALAARNNQLNPQDTQGGTFTVTNVGTFGSLMGTPIINQPQVAILALGAIKKRPVVVETPSGDAILVRHMMYISMSYDHRIVDGAMGSKFLADVAKTFEAWDANRQWFQYL